MKRVWIPIVLILLVAAYLRLYKIDQYMTFLGDEGRDVLVVKRMIVDHKFTLLGPTASVGGFFLGPIYYYFMLPFLWAWKLDPVGPAVMVGLFGVATVYLVYLSGLVMSGRVAALMAASLYAVSPLVISYSRSSWNPNVVPFFATALVLALWKLKETKCVIYAWIAGIALGIGIQLHYLFLFLFAVVCCWYILPKNKILNGGIVAATIGGFIIGVLPFLAFELRHDFTNTRSIIQFLLKGNDTGLAGNYFSTVADVVNRLFGRLVFRLPGPELWEKFPAWYLYSTQGVTIFAIILSVVMLFAHQLLAVWLIVPLLLFGFYHKAIYDYYFGIFFPLPFLLVGFILARGYWNKRFRIIALVLWAGLLIFNWNGRPFVHTPNNQLAQVRTIARTAYNQTDGKPFNFALITGGNSDHAYRYFFEIWGNPPVVIENTQNDPERTTVTDQLIIICEDTGCVPLGHPLWEVAGFGRAEITGTWEVPFVKIFKLKHYEGT